MSRMGGNEWLLGGTLLGLLITGVLAIVSYKQSKQNDNDTNTIIGQGTRTGEDVEKILRDNTELRHEVNNLTTLNSKLQTKLSESTLKLYETITGGSSFCTLHFNVMQDEKSVRLIAIQHGENPLTGIKARIVDLELFEKKQQHLDPTKGFSVDDLLRSDLNIEIGDMPQESSMMLEVFPIDFYGEMRRFNIFFTAKNGFFTQSVLLVKTGIGWVQASQVTRTVGDKSETILVDVPDNFPKEKVNFK